MPSLRSLRALAAVALAALLAACGDDGSGPPATKTSADLEIVRVRADAPALTGLTRSFWAVNSRDSELRMYFAPLASGGDSTEFLRFRVDEGSLAARPDGSPIARGDSVLITVTVLDARLFLVSFQPSGLRFSVSRPALLRWKLDERDDDLNEDGVVNANDEALLGELHVWRQEVAGLPWTITPSRVIRASDEIDADILGFSNYAVAY